MLKYLYKIGTQKHPYLNYHIYGWAIFIFYEVAVSGILSGSFSPVINYVLFYIINVFTFYFQANIILPRSEKNGRLSVQKTVLFVVLNLALYCLLFAIATFLIHSLSADVSVESVYTNRYFAGIIWRGMYFIIYGTAYYLLKRYIEQKNRGLQDTIEIKRIENLLLVSQQNYLRAQINPHLLFNTLNFIRYSVKRNPAEADLAITYLSDIMSFALDTNRQSQVLVSDELEQIANIIRLNRLRFGPNLKMDYEFSLHNPSICIIPIVLLTLVENIFKHGNLVGSSFVAKIDFTSTKSEMRFTTINESQHTFGSREKGNGLKNIEERLQAFYGEKFNFTYFQTGNIFQADLRISLI